MKYLLSALFCIISFSACITIGSDCIEPVAGNYEFQLSATLTPAKDTFKVGDTIIIESTFDNQVFERKTEREYLLDDFLFYPATSIAILDTIPVGNSGIECFDYYVCDSCKYELRSFSSGLKTLEGQYLYDGANYYLKFFLIPKKAGLFFLNQLSFVKPYGREQDFPGKCGGRSSAHVLMNGGGDNNLEFLESIQDTAFYNLVMDKLQLRFYDSGGYCFYVKE